MKVNSVGEEIIVYLNHFYTSKIDFLDLEALEIYMNKLFVTLKETYDIKVNGYYDIDVYLDNNYGVIIHMQKEEVEYYDYFSDQVDTQVTIHNNVNFLYKIDDFFAVKNYLVNSDFALYKYNDELYLKLNNKIDNISFGNMLEYCTEICYDIDKIIKANNLLFCNK